MFLLPLVVLALAADPEVKSEAVELKTDTGTLAGMLDLPPTPGPWPVVLIHPGSGTTDKDGNAPAYNVKTDAYKMLGRALVERGIACLRIDKRGIGGSLKARPKQEDMRIETLVDDAAAWVKFLRADKRFTKVGLIGQSEGSLVGILAGQKEKVDAFVSLCGSGRRFSDLIREQLKDQLTKEQTEKSEAILKALEAGKTVDDVPKELTAVSKQVADLYRRSVQPYLISVFKYDPAAEVGKLGCPVLVVTGTTDFQISAADGERLAAGAKGARHVAVKNMCHVLKETATPNRAVQALIVYPNPKLPLHPKLADELADFLKGALGAGK